MSTQTARPPDRVTVINKAVAEYESAGKTIQSIASRESWINDALHVAGMKPLDSGDAGKIQSLGAEAGQARSVLVVNAAKEWDGESGLQRIVSKATYVNGELIRRGLPRMTEAEAQGV